MKTTVKINSGSKMKVIKLKKNGKARKVREVKKTKTFVVAFREAIKDGNKWRIKNVKASSKRDAEAQINAKFDYNGFKVLEIIKEG